MFIIKQSEATAARRRIPVLLVDITDGFTPETGVVTPTINISKNGAASASGAGTWTEISNGQYYYEFTAGEIDTLGWISVNIEKATVSRDFNAVVHCVAYDAYAATNLGLTAIPAVATGSLGAIPTTGTGANQIAVNGSGAISTVNTVSGSVGSVTGNVSGSVASVVGNVGGNVVGSIGSLTATAVQNIWDDATSSLTTVGSIGKLLADNVNATISSRATDAGVWSVATRTLTAGTNIVLAKGTGITGFNDISATDVWAAATRTLSSGANIVLAKGTGITGFNDITSQSVWDVQTSAITAVNSIGVQLKTNIDVATSTRMATFTYTTPPTVVQIADGVWDEVLSGHLTVGTTGAALNSASSSGDPWNTVLPGAYGAGTAGNIIGNRIDVATSTRLASASYTTPPTAATIATQVWSETLPGSYTATQAGFKLNAAGSAADPWATTLPGAYTSGTAGFIIGNRLDAAVSSRSTLTDALVWSYATRALTDKVGFSLSGTQSFNLTGNITGNLSGSVGSVSGNVGGSVASVVGSIGGNVNGSVGSVSGNVAGNVVGSVGSVSGSVGSVSNVSTIWDHLTTSILTTNSIGLLLKTNVDATISSRLASSSYSAAPSAATNADAVWTTLTSTYDAGTYNGTFGKNILRDSQDSKVGDITTHTSGGVSRVDADVHAIANDTAAATSFKNILTGVAGETLTANLAGNVTGFVETVHDPANIADAVWQENINTGYVSPDAGWKLWSLTGGGGGGGSSASLVLGGFKLKSEMQGSNGVIELLNGSTNTIELALLDNLDSPVAVGNTDTISVKIYSTAGTLVATYAGTIVYDIGGLITFNIDTTTTNNSARYNVVAEVSNGTDIVKFGPIGLWIKSL